MKRNLVNQFVKMLLPALAAILAIVCALGTFGWFSRSHNVTGTGTNIQTKSVEELQILNTEDVDISMSAVEEITVRLPYNEGSATKLSPTAHGSFTFRVKDNSSEAQIPYDFIYKLSVENDFNKDTVNNGFYPNTNDTERKQALQYINSHLLFFSGYDNGTYSGWLQSGEAIRHTAEQNPQTVTVYWVWVDQYKQIFEENSGLIDEKTRKEIAAYYGGENAKKMLADGASPAEAYNVADTVIGMTLKYICFLIEVSKA